MLEFLMTKVLEFLAIMLLVRQVLLPKRPGPNLALKSIGLLLRVLGRMAAMEIDGVIRCLRVSSVSRTSEASLPMRRASQTLGTCAT